MRPSDVMAWDRYDDGYPVLYKFRMGAGLYKGIYTQQFAVADLDAVKRWYTTVFNKEPYFDKPFYVGFNIAVYEFGLMPTRGDAAAGSGGVYWGVEDLDAELRRLIELGAIEHEPIRDVGDGIRKAAVRDPFGNIFGIIYNPHFAGSH